MKHGFLLDEDWAELERLYTSAYGWMLKRSLKRELEYLRRRPLALLTTGDEARLKELEEWAAEMRAIEGPTR